MASSTGIASAWGRRPPLAKTPMVLQMEAVECGAASLGIVMAYHGLWLPLTELREACGVSRDGSKASNLIRAARRCGFDARGFKMELEDLRDLPVPFIVFWNFNHFLVVEGFRGRRVLLNDPADGHRMVSIEEFDQAFSGVVLQVAPGPDFKRGGARPSPVRDLFERLQGSTSPLVFCVLAGLLLVVPGLVTPLFAQIFVDHILVREMQDWMGPLLVGMAVTGIVSGLLRYFQLRTLRRLNFKLSTSMTGKFLWHLLHLPASFFTHRFAGEVASRSAINAELAAVVSRKMALLVIDAVMVLFYGAVLWLLDPHLAAVGMVSAGVQLGMVRLSMSRSNVNLKLSMEQGKAAGIAISGLENIEQIKASGLEGDFFSRWAGYHARAANSQQEVSFRNAMVGSVPPFANALTVAAILVVGGHRVVEGFLTVGTLVAIQSLMSSFLGPISRLVAIGPLIRQVAAGMSRIDDVLLQEEDPGVARPAAGVADAASCRLRGQVELRGVTFGFSRLDPPLIEQFDLSVCPGQWVALVGASGSGKSTLSRLIAGLYEPWEGEIRFDGELRSAMPREVLTNSIALVEQDVFMFRGSIKENLGLWDGSMPDDVLVRSCQDADIHDVVLAQPGGYDGQLIDGAANLSGGQRQRLEIARALAADPAILILDEATSGLDSESERTVLRNIRMRGCTCIVVAHRLSTIRDCDEIVVLDRGRVVQRGRHADLIREDGAYRRLVLADSHERGPAPGGREGVGR